MLTYGPIRSALLLCAASCQPLHDLDAASRGGDTADAVAVTASSAGSPINAPHGVGPTVAEPTSTPTPATEGTESSAPGDSGTLDDGVSETETSSSTPAATTEADEVSAAPNDEATNAANTSASNTPTDDEASLPGGTTEQDAGTATAGSDGDQSVGTGNSEADATSDEPAAEFSELPIDLPNNPIEGDFTVSEQAEWEVDGVMRPTYEIVTPSASYWLVKSLGMIVSMSETKAADVPQWIAFSSGFRPLRGLPSFGTFDTQPVMTTTIDEDTKTRTHLRLYSTSQSGDWQLVYDFYPTHFTLTVSAAPLPYGIAYRGVPAGALDSTDQFVRADGTSQGALVSSTIDLPGPAEWAYIADPTVGQSMFMIQHANDEQVDRFQTRDNDSALFSFGDGNLTALPARYSFGLVNSANHTAVEARASFIIDAIK